MLSDMCDMATNAAILCGSTLSILFAMRIFLTSQLLLLYIQCIAYFLFINTDINCYYHSLNIQLIMQAQAIIKIVDEKFKPGIFRKYQLKNIIKHWRKRTQKSKQRFFKLKQWNYTEQTYLQKLIVLRDQIKKPLRDSEMIEQYQQAILFPNLQSMIHLAQEMKAKINYLVQNWSPTKTVLAPTIQSLVVYLKIYKQYSNNFQKSDKIIQELKKDPKFSSVVKIFNVQDYLIKPVQRPLQYRLFLSDYLKYLPSNHIDKQNLQKAMNTLLKIADEINDFVEKQLRAQKLITLEQTFGDIIQSTREYKSSFQAMHPDFLCRVYVFNDLLLIVKIIYDKEQKFKYQHLCGGSYTIRQPDNANFKNRLYICGSYESIHLTFKSADDANHAHTLIQGLIAALYQKQSHRYELLSQAKLKRQTMVMNRHSINNDYKWKQQYEYRLKMRVEVIGVQKRLYEKQWKIVYLIKLQLGKPEQIYQIACYELDQLKQIQRYIRQVYTEIQYVPSLDTRFKGMCIEDIKNDFTKYYEYKCILIQDFLNFCLRWKQLCKKPQYIAYKLKLNETLWDYLNRFSMDCACEACLNSEPLLNMQSYLKQKQSIKNRRFMFCILNSFLFQNKMPQVIKAEQFKKFSQQQKLIWSNCKLHRIDYGLQNRNHFGRKMFFHVRIKLIGQQSDVLVEGASVNNTCRQIVEDVCIKRGINQSMDFSLVYVHGKYEYYLDSDQYVYDAIKHVEDSYKRFQNQKRQSASTRGSIFANFSKSMDGYGQMFADNSVVDEPLLFLRKSIFLAPSLQQWSCTNNPERYPLILGQMLRKFQQQLLLLSIEEIKTFCALFYGIEQFNTIIFSKKIFCNDQKIKKYLPESKWNFISSQFIQKVRQILENEVKPCKSILQVYEMILKHFGDKVGWLTQYFLAENAIPDSLSAKQKNLLIGVNYHKVIVCRRFNTTSLLQFPILKFEYRTSGDALFIDTEQKSYKFIGNGWVYFQNLIDQYRAIQQMHQTK